jgi:hypothetical protein
MKGMITINQEKLMKYINAKGGRTVAQLQVDTRLSKNEVAYALKGMDQGYEEVNGAWQKKPAINPMMMRWV